MASISDLNARDDSSTTSVKVLYLGRHGEGYRKLIGKRLPESIHSFLYIDNVAERKYGTKVQISVLFHVSYPILLSRPGMGRVSGHTRYYNGDLKSVRYWSLLDGNGEITWGRMFGIHSRLFVC